MAVNNQYSIAHAEVNEISVKPDGILKASEESDSGVMFPSELTGCLSKWTNYIHGWQQRYFVLREGILSYFKSEEDINSGCRGAIHIGRAEIRTYDFDNCRFDVTVSDTYWHLRTVASEERDRWLDAIETHRTILEHDQHTSHRRSPSLVSLQSVLSERSVNHGSLSNPSQSSKATADQQQATLSSAARSLQERTLELLTFRNLLLTQLDDLQAHFHDEQGISDAKSTLLNSDVADAGDSPPLVSSNTSSTSCAVQQQTNDSFRLDLAKFRITAHSMTLALSSCCELLAQQEQSANARVERERQKRAKIKHAYQHVCDKLAISSEQRAVLQRHCDELVKQRADAASGAGRSTGCVMMGAAAVLPSTPTKTTPALFGPEFQEGPHGRLNEEEFFDAIDAALDHEEEVDAEESRQKAVYERLQSQKDVLQQIQETNDAVTGISGAVNNICSPATASPCIDGGTRPAFQMFPSLEELHIDPHLAHVPQEITEVLREQYDYALQSPDDGVWQLFVQEGDMRMYRREIEEGGLPIDPLKALHTVHGVTAREIAYYFYAPETRMEWETTVDKVDVVVSLAENTKIFYQLHKRVWPTAQRESLFWSHMRREFDLSKRFEPSRKHHLVDSWIVCNKSIDLVDIPCGGGRVRVGLIICMVSQTYIPVDKKDVPLELLKRSDVHTRLAYCAIVNPGGWVPAAGMRQVYKREYPRFLRKYTKYVAEKVKLKPLMWA